MTASATSTAINMFRRPAAWMACSIRGGVVADRRATSCSAGARPKRHPHPSPSRIATASPVPSTVVRREIGMPRTRIGGTALSAFVPQSASAAPTSRAAQGEQDALGQEQPADVPGLRAEREANGHFLASRARAREDQVCGVAAHRQEEQQRDRLEDGQRGGKQALRSAGRLPEGQNLGSHAGVGLGKRDRQLTHGRVQLRLCGCTSGAWREPAEHGVLATAAIVDLTRAVEEQRRQRYGKPHVERQAHHGALKTAWRDADNRQVLAVDAEGAPDRVCRPVRIASSSSRTRSR